MFITRNYSVAKYFLILLCFLQTTCNPSNNNDAEDNSSSINHKIIDKRYSTEDNKIIIEWSPSDIYQFRQSDFFTIKVLIINNSNNDINYLSESCYGLGKSFTFNPTSFNIGLGLSCNSVRPEIETIKEGEHLKYNINVQRFKDSIILKDIGLDFRVIHDTILSIEEEEQREILEKIWRTRAQEKDIIWSNKWSCFDFNRIWTIKQFD